MQTEGRTTSRTGSRTGGQSQRKASGKPSSRASAGKTTGRTTNRTGSRTAGQTGSRASTGQRTRTGDYNAAQKSRQRMAAKRRKRRQRMIKRVLLIMAGILFVMLVIGIVIGNRYFSTHFMKGTTINDIDVSAMEVDQLESIMRQYRIEILQRTKEGDKISEVIDGDQIGVRVSNMDQLDEILDKQNVFKAMIHAIKKDTITYNIEKLYDYEETALVRAVDKLSAFQPGFWESPQNADLSEYSPETGFRIKPHEMGNELEVSRAKESIYEAVRCLETRIDLEELDLYKKPTIYADDERLKTLLPQLKKYTDLQIKYTFGDQEEIIDGNVLKDWLIVDEQNLKVAVDREKTDEFVVGLRKKYDTIFRDREFATSYGKTITISGGDYGWWMDYAAEQEELYTMIENGESGDRVPVYRQEAAAYGAKDIGNTYVEVNLTAQHLYVYVDGQKVLESDFVSGNAARQFDTPEGVYGITYKEQDAMLVGENYETPVSFWMPFNGNVGLHDAIWRDQFGGDIYTGNGSHGCVNLPYNVAKKIYGYVSKKTPVICYRLSGTQSSHLTDQSAQEKAQSVIDAIDKIGEVKKDSEKRITRARQLYREIPAEARECVTNLSTLEKAESDFNALKK